MMKLKMMLQQQAQTNNVKWEIIEQDYILSWILEGISRVPILKNNLIFKGGTSLKKVYFGNYRFSQDLDFTVIQTETLQTSLKEAVEEACSQASSILQSLGENVVMRSSPYVENKPHPEGQQAFTIQSKLPWHRDFHTTVYIEVTFNEIMVLPPKELKIIHPYNEALEGSIWTYSLEEIVAEKIRALLQFAKKLHERGWARSRVRDYYDLWKILQTYSANLNLEVIPQVVAKKCAYKNIKFEKIDEIFQEKLILNLEKEWEPWLSGVVPQICSKDEVIKSLRRDLSKIFKP